MARTPNRTGLGDNYKQGGKRKKKITYMQEGAKLGKDAANLVQEEKRPPLSPDWRESWNTGMHKLGPAFWKEGSSSPRPIYEPTTKTFFPRLQNIGQEIMKTFRGEGHSMQFGRGMDREHGGPVERSTSNQGNQSLMGGNVEQHD